LIKFILITLLSMHLYANHILKNVYYINSDTVTLQTIINDINSDFVLFKIENHRHTKRIKSTELIKILKKHGYKGYTSKHNYVSFIKKSPINTTKIKSRLKEYYHNNYEQIDIRNIIVEPRSYTTSIADNYTIEIRPRNYLKKDGIINIKNSKKSKIFFNYTIDANVNIYITRKKIRKNTELSAINSSKKSIILEKFRAKPIQTINKSTLQTKRHIAKGKVLTIRDVETLSVVKKGAYLNIVFKNNNIDISFSAKALQDGKLNELIKVAKPDGTRLKVRVIGKNQAEMR